MTETDNCLELQITNSICLLKNQYNTFHKRQSNKLWFNVVTKELVLFVQQ